MYEFRYFLQCKIKAASACKPRACAASTQRELQACSLKDDGERESECLALIYDWR